MPSKTLKERFHAWNADSTRNRIAEKSFPNTLDGSKMMLEEALWMAYEEGYKQSLVDIKAEIDKLSRVN